MQKPKTIVGVKELRENLSDYISLIEKGWSFTVVKRSQPVFRITPIQAEENWEVITDFTKIKKGGVEIDEILSRL